MTEAGWTREKPSKEGVYWFRWTVNSNSLIVSVAKDDCDWRVLEMGHQYDGALAGYGDGEWLGPITPDSYQQGRVDQANDRADRLMKDRRDLLDVKTTEGMSCSEWVMRTAKAERSAKELQQRVAQLEKERDLWKGRHDAELQGEVQLIGRLNTLQADHARVLGALRNCHVTARRALSSKTADLSRMVLMFEHIKRYCEEVGIEQDGVLRAASLPAQPAPTKTYDEECACGRTAHEAVGDPEQDHEPTCPELARWRAQPTRWPVKKCPVNCPYCNDPDYGHPGHK